MYNRAMRLLDWTSDMVGWGVPVLTVSLLLSKISAEPSDKIEQLEQRIDTRVVELAKDER